MSNPPILISLTCTLRPRRDDHGHRRTETLARADRRGTRTSRSPRIRLKVEVDGLAFGGRGIEPRIQLRGSIPRGAVQPLKTP